MAARTSERDTATAILDVAERLAQTRGFNAFSYADVAAELGITKAALHYHFPGKAELGAALLARYCARFGEALERIDVDAPDAASKLTAYADLYATVLAADRMCLCGMLAADYDTLPEPMRLAITGFFDDNERWLAGIVEEGRRDGTVRAHGDPREVAQLIIGTLEGAMLVARAYRDVDRFESSAHQLLAELTSAPTSS